MSWNASEGVGNYSRYPQFLKQKAQIGSKAWFHYLKYHYTGKHNPPKRTQGNDACIYNNREGRGR